MRERGQGNLPVSGGGILEKKKRLKVKVVAVKAREGGQFYVRGMT